MARCHVVTHSNTTTVYLVPTKIQSNCMGTDYTNVELFFQRKQANMPQSVTMAPGNCLEPIGIQEMQPICSVTGCNEYKKVAR